MPSNRRRGRSRRPSDPNRVDSAAPGQQGGAIPSDIDARSLSELETAGITTARSLEALSRDALLAQAREIEFFHADGAPFAVTAAAILAAQAEAEDEGWASGILEIEGEGYGLIRRRGITGGPDDIYVPAVLIRRLGLRQGDTVGGVFRLPNEGERFNRIVRIELVAGMDPESARTRPHFGELTPIHPNELLNLETTPGNLAQRMINLVNPLGKGQRALIVSPPKAGKTTVLKNIAHGVATNYPEISLMVALIGERPEEVTDMRRSIRGEVYSSTFDEPTEHHTHVAEMALEVAKRRAEAGEDVVLLLDSITRLARAYNLELPSSGRTLSGGIDPVALFPPKRFFGAARKLEEGGSLTIIGTCLVDTGSKMDEVIYEEFKGTGNSELVLNRTLAEKRIFPAIDVQRSGTRREELLLDEPTLRMVWTMRRMLSAVGANEGIELLLNRLGKSESNAEFLASLTKGTEGQSGGAKG
jgi:transcription termination factor Rho